MDITKKRYIDELSFEEARGWVLDNFIYIEKMQIDREISAFLKLDKQKKHFFESVFLHSSIMNFGAKIKCLKNIYKKEKTIVSKNFRNNLYKLNNLRNAFAHCEGRQHINVTIGSEVMSDVKIERKFEIMKNDGSIETKTVKNKLSDFYKIYNSLKEEFHSHANK